MRPRKKLFDLKLSNSLLKVRPMSDSSCRPTKFTIAQMPTVKLIPCDSQTITKVRKAPMVSEMKPFDARGSYKYLNLVLFCRLNIKKKPGHPKMQRSVKVRIGKGRDGTKNWRKSWPCKTVKGHDSSDNFVNKETLGPIEDHQEHH